MSKILFIPVSVLGGIAAGFVGKKIFEQIWGLIDSEEPPDPKHRETTWLKLLAALALEGAIFRAVRGAVRSRRPALVREDDRDLAGRGAARARVGARGRSGGGTACPVIESSRSD